MIVLTGGAGFIGSVVLGYLNRQGIDDIIVCDYLKNELQYKNIANKQYCKLIMPFEEITDKIDFIIHLGANSNTLEKDWNSIYGDNILSTRRWYERALADNIPMIFSSSAAVMGNGQGPENLYSFTKQSSEFELRNAAVMQLFNVYGPNEYHKGRMASTIFHWYNQLTETGILKIFHNSKNYSRDFIWVEDVAESIFKCYENYRPGVYQLGTGRSANFETVADILLSSVNGEKEYIPMPSDLSKQYQTSTKAKPAKLRRIGVDVNTFKTIEQGINLYLEYLVSNKIY